MIRLRTLTAIATLAIVLAGCSTPIDPSRVKWVGTQNRHKSLIERMTPVFKVHHYDEGHNKIGTPTVRLDSDGDEEITVSPKIPTVYYQSRSFKTDKGQYLNLIYRIHFEKVPFSIFPFHLTAGKNVGLFVVVTVDVKQRPVLVTTVHTCGCYMVSIPTNFLSKTSRPDGWPTDTVPVYGETLPAALNFGVMKTPKLVVTIRPDVHRVMNVEVMERRQVPRFIEADNKPMHALRQLRNGSHVTSFFHTDGWKKGYVKGAVKPWETLLMSIISFDFFVGTDKDYGSYSDTENRFYTSLKVWRRKDSDMWDFKRFLTYWGWDL